MGYQSFEELRVWQAAKKLAVQIYKATTEGRLARDFGMRDQMRRAAVSIAANIAEGYDRGSDKNFVRFLFVAKGSLSELRTHLAIATEVGYIADDVRVNFLADCTRIGTMLTRLIKARVHP
ncbi:MAG TPA: four helix bundle protein [Acidobacteriota bacterium]|nr:four helix bundle protein [Acidobacteriota bacterium]HNR38744.1 four helix bundle protein [Acidobacteriota bacterium]HNU01453.1 four helix bundle protein [Acidobacteriota bacterium]